MASKVGVGIDVSKDTLDVASSDGGYAATVANDETGLRQLAKHLCGLGAHRVLLEASGGYERDALVALFDAGLPVVLIQPLRARHFAQAMGRYAKTDAIDAAMLARMAELVVDHVPLWEPTEEALADLKALVERRQALLAFRDAEKKRIRLAREIVRPDIEQAVADLTAKVRDVEARIDQLVAASTRLAKEVEVLEATKGVGRITAASLRVALPELGTLTRNEIAALTGVAPMNRDSGKWSGQRFIRGGRPDARKALYMATLAATRSNPVIRSRYRSLVERGKKPKVALVACMRKLIIHLNSQLRSYLAGPTNAGLAET